MSRFYASIQGSRGPATRQGHRAITGHVRGWTAGVEVDGHGNGCEGARDADVFEVYLTHGSNRPGQRRLLGRVVDGVWEPEDIAKGKVTFG